MTSIIIMFDGPDGLGKTTQLHLVGSELQRRGLGVYQTRMNGGTQIGEALREVILGNYERPVVTDYYILQAITAAFIEDLAVKRDKYDVILVDRSPVSLLAYQVYTQGFSADIAYPAVEAALQAINPALLLCLTAPIGTIMDRKKNRDNSDYFEAQPREYHEKVIAGYQAAEERIQVTMVDAEGSVEEVFARIMPLIESRLPPVSA